MIRTSGSMHEMSAHSDDAQYVTLCLGTEVFAVPVAYVREIIDYRETFRIPEGPHYLLGLIDVRGRGTPVIDLRLRLGMSKVQPTSATRIMVLDIPLEDRVLPLGMVADRVLEVATYATSQVENAPDVGIPWRSDYIHGVVRMDTGFVVIFNLQKLLAESSTAMLLSAAEDKAA
jgi:purine-binding chemotaxis protein CheW